MKPSMSERWARHIAASCKWVTPWLCWGAASFFLTGALYYGRDIAWNLPTFFLLAAVILGILGMVWWERGGFRHIIAAQKEEITRLRNDLATATTPPTAG
jgi:hypothetical protein